MDFHHNFRALLDWYGLPLDALVEIKMSNHQPLFDSFPFTKMIEVLVVGHLGGLVVLWDDSILDLDGIPTS